MTDQAEHFRQQADRCLQVAEQARNQHDRESWLQLAADWMQMADEVTRREKRAQQQ
ncbi:hypothetical protein [Bradyrhizobium sp.]|jgi:hypothetical protein|uniref:hypothetical protein n=1 Tax=Bradyrhizobium sp. TaxID=376 RepID=UPI0012E86368|nr:hypothetical protein [Bradyrhizobium sp.]